MFVSPLVIVLCCDDLVGEMEGEEAHFFSYFCRDDGISWCR